MSIVPFLAAAFGAGALSLLTRRRRDASAAIGIGGLLAAAVAASTIRAEAGWSIAGGILAGTDFARLFLVLGSLSGLLLTLLAMATRWLPSLPGATLVGLGATGLALAAGDAGSAVVAATGGALAAILVTVSGTDPRTLVIAIREMRAVVVAGLIALVGTALVAGPLAGRQVDPAVLGVAYLAVVVGVAIRLGAIPFHLWAARAADAAPEIGLPIVMAWGPAGLAVVGLAWVDGAIAPLGEPLAAERLIVGLVAVASIVLGTAAALAHDDLGHVVGYSIVADAGVALLGLAALDPAAWEPTRAWLLALVASKTAFAAWAGTARATFGTRRIGELRGWSRRSPPLLAALALVAVASIGWPGMAAFSAREALVDVALDGPLAGLALVGALSIVLVYVRIAAVGVRTAGPAARGAEGYRPVWPSGRPARVSLSLWGDVVGAWAANRTLIAASCVLALAALATMVSAGGLGVAGAAAGAAPGLAQPAESFSPDQPGQGGPAPSEPGPSEPGPSEPGPSEPSPSARP